MCPISWEGYVVTVAFVLSMGLINLEGDLTRRSIAAALLVAAFCAVVVLTWGDPDRAGRPSFRETLWNWQTLVWLLVLLALGAAVAAASYQQRQCPGCNPQPYWKPQPPVGPHPLRG